MKKTQITYVLFAFQVTADPDEEIDEEKTWDGEEDDGLNTFFDMDEFVLQESSGYMLPTLRFLAVFHTVISLVCLFGYYCLKVGTPRTLALLQHTSFTDI